MVAHISDQGISIHALREEGDKTMSSEPSR